MHATITPTYTADSAFKPTHGASVELLTIAEACQRMRCGKSKLYELFASGELPRIKLHGQTRVAVADIDRIIAAAVAAAEADAAARRVAK